MATKEMVPAMMGMMGMMSFKGMMFSMMSFMISKMMLLMKILEKKGGGGLGGGGAGGGGDGGWPAGGAGGGAWMPAGGQDYAGGGGGGGGGYDANGQWQSRSIVENLEAYKTIENEPRVAMVEPIDSSKWQDELDKDLTQDNRKWISKNLKNQPIITFVKPVDAAQWKSRYIDENPGQDIENKPEISFVKTAVRYNNKVDRERESHNPVLIYKKSNVNFDSNNPGNAIGQGYANIYAKEKSNSRLKRDLRREKLHRKLNPNDQEFDLHNGEDVHIKADDTKLKNNAKLAPKLRQKRSILDMLQNSYIYWVNQILGLNNNRRTNPSRYKIVNGVKYIYYPYKMQKPKMPKELQMNGDLKPLVAVEEFNKGEIVDGGIESRMNRKKFNKLKDSVNDTVEDNPWE